MTNDRGVYIRNCPLYTYIYIVYISYISFITGIGCLTLFRYTKNFVIPDHVLPRAISKPVFYLPPKSSFAH